MIVGLKKKRAEYSGGNGTQHASGLVHAPIAHGWPDMGAGAHTLLSHRRLDLPCVLIFARSAKASLLPPWDVRQQGLFS
ncbi:MULTISPECIES: hypothetical protein [Paraburkholderia]|uniref:hypothetical protein n=1 Tax=Paraburkholderia TaxID=1822464 RepID=UPI002AB5FCB8|nr:MULTISPECIES: hypothetical protein [Paraburkholderia]